MAAQHHDATLNEDGPYTTPLDSTHISPGPCWPAMSATPKQRPPAASTTKSPTTDPPCSLRPPCSPTTSPAPPHPNPAHYTPLTDPPADAPVDIFQKSITRGYLPGRPAPRRHPDLLGIDRPKSWAGTTVNLTQPHPPTGEHVRAAPTDLTGHVHRVADQNGTWLSSGPSGRLLSSSQRTGPSTSPTCSAAC